MRQFRAMISQAYWRGVLAGVPVQVEFESPELRRSLEPLLREGFVTAQINSGSAALRIRVTSSRRFETLDEIRSDTDRVRVFRSVAAGWVLEFPCARALLYPPEGEAQLALDAGFDDLPLKERQTALLLTLIWLLSPHGLHVLHAAAVALAPDCAMILAGDSGNGKSSSFAALLGAGCEGIADDVAVIGQQGGDFLTWPLALGVSLAPAALPFAGPMAAGVEHIHDGKQMVFPQRWARRAVRLRGLVQMKLQPDAPSRLESLSPGAALLGLLPAAGGVMLDDGAAAARLGALGRMAQSLRCFRLDLGSDLYGRGADLRALLQQGLEGGRD